MFIITNWRWVRNSCQNSHATINVIRRLTLLHIKITMTILMYRLVRFAAIHQNDKFKERHQTLTSKNRKVIIGKPEYSKVLVNNF